MTIQQHASFVVPLLVIVGWVWELRHTSCTFVQRINCSSSQHRSWSDIALHEFWGQLYGSVHMYGSTTHIQSGGSFACICDFCQWADHVCSPSLCPDYIHGTDILNQERYITLYGWNSVGNSLLRDCSCLWVFQLCLRIFIFWRLLFRLGLLNKRDVYYVPPWLGHGHSNRQWSVWTTEFLDPRVSNSSSWSVTA